PWAKTRLRFDLTQSRFSRSAANKKARGTPAPLLNLARWYLFADRGSAVLFLDDTRRLAAQAAQVIELGAAHLTATDHFDRVDHRRQNREHALHPFAVGNLAHRKALVDSRAGAADTDPFISLHAGTVAFHHLDVDDHGVAGREIGNLLAGGKLVVLLFF